MGFATRNRGKRRRRRGVILIVLAALAAGLLTPVLAEANRIAFSSDRGGSFGIWTIKLNGSAPVQLTDPDSGGDSVPAWAPNGLRIAFISDRDGDGEVWMVNADGRNLKQVTKNTAHESFVQWAPDGRSLVVVSDRGGQSDLWLLRPNGSDARRLTTSPAGGSALDPGFSPDGRSIVYTRDQGIFRPLHILNVRTKATRELTDFQAFGASYTADGKRIVFDSTENPLGTNPDFDPEIFSILPSGKGLRQLTDTGLSQGLDEEPDPSRDGRTRIVFISERDAGSRDLWAINATGAGPLQLTDDPAFDRDPAYRPFLRCGRRVATIVGSARPDRLGGFINADIIVGLGKRDRLSGRGGRDRLCGMKGNDILRGGKGRDLLIGGPGFDVCIGGPGRDRYRGCERIRS